MYRFGIIFVLIAMYASANASFTSGHLDAEIYGSMKYSGFNGDIKIEFEDHSNPVTPIFELKVGNWVNGSTNGYQLQYSENGLILSVVNSSSYMIQFPAIVNDDINYFEFVVNNADSLTSDQTIYFPGSIHDNGAISGNGSWYYLRDDFHANYTINGTLGLYGSFSSDSYFEIRYGCYDDSPDEGSCDTPSVVPAPGAVILAGFGTALTGYLKRRFASSF